MLNVDRPKILAAGIDTLNVGFNINKWLFDDATFKLLRDAKLSAGSKLFGSKGVTVDWFGKEFAMLPKGSKGYEYILMNDDLRLLIAENCQGGKIMPEVFAEFNSAFLWGKRYDYAFKQTEKWIREWAAIGGNRINRADLCVDIGVALPVIDVKTELITRARNRVDYHQIEHYSKGMRDTGYSAGSDIQRCRIYDKLYQATHEKKLWFLDIWARNGHDGKSPVTRIEGQLRRQFLKEMSVDSYIDLFERTPDLWRVFTEEFITYRIKNPQDSNHRRWQLSPIWESAQDAKSMFGQCLGVQRWKQKQPRIEPLMAQMKGLMVSEVALDSQIRGEYFAIGRLKTLINEYLDSEEFNSKVLERRGRYGSM